MIHCALRRRLEHKCHQKHSHTVSHGSGASFSAFACGPWLLTRCSDDGKPRAGYGYGTTYDAAGALEMTDTTSEFKSLGRPSVFCGRDDECPTGRSRCVLTSVSRVTMWPASWKERNHFTAACTIEMLEQGRPGNTPILRCAHCQLAMA